MQIIHPIALGKWPKSFLKEAQFTATRSKDPSTKVGAIVVNQKKRIVSTGYNGPPQGCHDQEMTRDKKLLRTLHAELNCVLFASQPLDDCTIFVTAPTCAQCMAAIIQVGITTVYALAAEKEFEGRWLESCVEAQIMAEEAGVEYYQVLQESK